MPLRKHVFLYIVGVALCWTTPLSASLLDSIYSLPAIGVPVVAYSPENNWEFGAAVQGYFRLPESQRTSIAQLDGSYSLNHRWYIHAQTTCYFGGTTPWLLSARIGYRNVPDIYYGRGKSASAQTLRQAATSYLSQRTYFQLQPLLELPAHWAIGPQVDFLYETVDLTDRVEAPSVYPTTLMWGLGLALQYDTRDRTYYPSQGVFFRFSALHYEPALGTTTRLTSLRADLRQYIPIYRELLFAWQFRADLALANNGAEAVPFQFLPTLGGQDLLRGVPMNMYRDNVMLALQAELRIPIYRILKACVFAGVGDVYNTAEWSWTVPQVSYGMGLRLAIHRAGINIRLDAARSTAYPEWNTWESYSFYLTATEAF